MIPLLVLLGGCGATGEPLQPAPAPTPPPELSQASTETVTVTGLIDESTPGTRAWTSVGDGRRYYCILAEDGRLLEGAADIGVDALHPESSIVMDGHLFGDVLVVERGVVTAADPATPHGLSAAPTDPAAAPEAAAPATPDAAAPAPPTTPPAAPPVAAPAPAPPAAPAPAPTP